MRKISNIKINGIDINNIPVLPQREIRSLIKKVQQKDHNSQDALDKVVKHNLRLVLTVVNRLKNSETDIEDLFQIGCIGLISAVNKFSLDYNVQFSTYAIPMIDGTIRTNIQKDKTIRITRTVQNNSYKIYTKTNELINKLQRKPTSKELMKELGMTSEEFTLAMESFHGTKSLFEPFSSGEGDSQIQLIDTIDNEDSTQEEWADTMWIKDCISKLKEKERIVIVENFLKDRSQKEIASLIGVTQAQVSRLRKQALNKMRNMVS